MAKKTNPTADDFEKALASAKTRMVEEPVHTEIIRHPNIEINTADIVSIVVSDCEVRLQQIHDENKTAAQYQLDRADKLTRALTSAIEKKYLDAQEDHACLIRKAFKDAGYNVTVTGYVSPSVCGNNSKCLATVALGLRLRDDIHADVHNTIEVTDHCKAELDEIVQARKQQEVHLTKVVEAKQGLSRLGTVERKTRADLARASLENSESGKAVLERILSQQLNIPGLKQLG